MPNCMNDDFLVGDLVKDQEWIGRCRQTANSRIIGPGTNFRMVEKQPDEFLDASLHAVRALRRRSGNVVENRLEIGKSWECVAEPHRPCLAQTARTCSSVANSPREAASFEAAMAERSSLDRTTHGVSSAPASCKIIRAISSCASVGRLRAISRACSRSLVMSTEYAFLARG